MNGFVNGFVVGYIFRLSLKSCLLFNSVESYLAKALEIKLLISSIKIFFSFSLRAKSMLLNLRDSTGKS